MRRPAEPPGPPPAHFRPLGSQPAERDPLQPLVSAPPSPPSRGLNPAIATGAALATLLLGAIVGFALGRGTADDGGPRVVALPSTTTTTRTPPPGDTIPQAPPTSVAPGTELAPSSIGSYEEPIPVGQAYILGLYEIEVLEVDLDATAALTAIEPTNPPPNPGRRHVLVTVAARCTDSTGPGCQGSLPFFVTDGTTEWHSFAHECGFVPDDLGEWQVVPAGAERIGLACFTVADDADTLLLGTEGFAGPVYFALER